jgi:hypothetical protein
MKSPLWVRAICLPRFAGEDGVLGGQAATRLQTSFS